MVLGLASVVLVVAIFVITTRRPRREPPDPKELHTATPPSHVIVRHYGND